MKSKKLMIILAALFLVVAIYLGSFRIYAFNHNFYKREFERHNVYRNVPDADNISLEVIGYLKGDGKLPEEFNERETMHMADVKRVSDALVLLVYISLVIFLALLLTKEVRGNIGKVLLYSGIAGIAVFAVILLFSLNFGFMFDIFHRIFFKQGTWLFYRDDLIINLFTVGFFYDALTSIVVTALLLSIVSLCAGLLMMRRR